MRQPNVHPNPNTPVISIVRQNLQAKPVEVPNIFVNGDSLIISTGIKYRSGDLKIIIPHKCYPVDSQRALEAIFSAASNSRFNNATLRDIKIELNEVSEGYIRLVTPLRRGMLQAPERVRNFVQQVIERIFEREFPPNLVIHPSLVHTMGMDFKGIRNNGNEPITLPSARWDELVREVTKRLILNMICIQGAAGEVFGRFLSDACRGHYTDLGLSEDLAVSARRFYELQTFCHLFLQVDSSDLSTGLHAAAGRVKLTKVDDSTVIKAKSIDPLLLVYESLKGIFEVIGTHGLPADMNMRTAVLRVCDNVEFEGVHIPLGQIIFNHIFSETATRDLPNKVHMIVTDSMAGIRALLGDYLS